MNSRIPALLLLLFLRILALCGSLAAIPALCYPAQGSEKTNAENTKANKDQSGPSADPHKVDARDRAITQQIRKAVRNETGLSAYGRNIKVITRNGKVTLLGPVRSEDEKRNLHAKAIEAAGQGNVADELVVVPPKR